MSAATAVPDKPQPPATPTVESELEQYYADLEARGDLEDDDTPAPPPAPAAASVTAPVVPPVPDASATSTTTTPAAPAVQAPAPPAARTEDEFWSEPDNDPNLPHALQGKSRREVYDANKRSRWEAMEAGQKKNDAERELAVTRGLLRTFQQSPAPVPAAPTATIPGHKVFGLDSSEAAFGKVDQVVDQLPGFVDQRIEQRASEIADARIAPLAATVNDLQQKTLIDAAEHARLSVRDALKLDADAYEGISDALKAYLYSHRLDPRVPQNWEAAVVDYRTHAARIIPHTLTTAITPPPAGSAVSAASPPLATVRKTPTTGDRKADAMLLDQLVSIYHYKRDSPELAAAYAKTVANIRAERSRPNDDE